MRGQCPRCGSPTYRDGYCPNCVEQRTHVNPVPTVKQFYVGSNYGTTWTLQHVPQFAAFLGVDNAIQLYVYHVVIPADYCMYDLSVIGPDAGEDPATVPGGALLVLGNNPLIYIPPGRPYTLDRKRFPCYVGQLPIYIMAAWIDTLEAQPINVDWALIYGDK